MWVINSLGTMSMWVIDSLGVMSPQDKLTLKVDSLGVMSIQDKLTWKIDFLGAMSTQNTYVEDIYLVCRGDRMCLAHYTCP